MLDKRIIDYFEKNKLILDIDYSVEEDKIIIKKMDFEILLSEDFSYEVKFKPPMGLYLSIILGFVAAILIGTIGIALLVILVAYMVYSSNRTTKIKKDLAAGIVDGAKNKYDTN